MVKIEMLHKGWIALEVGEKTEPNTSTSSRHLSESFCFQSKFGDRMGKIRYGKWGAWIARVGVLLHLLAVITAQPGFLSISCGGKTNHTAENNITWVTDAEYIDVGESADIGDASELAFGSYLQTLRFFPKPLNKSCYEFSVSPNVRYLLRLWFAVGNFSGYQQWPINFAFSIETVDMLFVQNVTAETHDPFNYEYILPTSGRAKYICLVRTSETHDPFISGIELRRLEDGMYADGWYESRLLVLESRVDAGGNSIVRYPRDKFDRIWATSPKFRSDLDVRNVSSAEAVSINNTQNLPPTAVMQTAWVVKDGSSFPLSGWQTTNRGVDTLVVWYFADIETLNTSESRSFYFVVDGAGAENPRRLITLVRNYSALEYPTMWVYAPTNFQLVKATNSTLFPILNAYEYYEVVSPESATTYKQDIDALDVMKRRFNIKDWISDPCHLIPWNGIRCDNISGLIRISEIDLSGRNLTGSVPNYIALLTALVNVSLNNNHFTGPLPNFTNLIMLERLYLENNNLSGTLEWLSKLRNLKELYLQNNNMSGTLEWLSKLKNLTKLNIENNNFSGVIPGQLLLNCSLKLNYSGNPYLSRGKSECILQNSKSTQRNNTWRRKLKVLGISLSGILIIASAVSVVYRKNFWKKEEGVAIERPKKETKHFLNQDYSMIMVPNPTKSRAFTLDEMIAATQNFSREIGRGGFGSVFFGELPEGKVIAVKVLSLFSRQGIHEFLNEVDLLSKISHKNLVSLLGYCNETREVMLIYEHMSGGSLRDHLYGPRAENFHLDWKKRLKIALDAAQGLEYLHVGCIPKIIHRDIKTANILLDSNLNGKLADFGLSRMTIDGEATHVTTAVKGTFGYLDPEYYNTQMLTEKSDVYSFGVVLLEIICGRPPIDIKLPEEELNIVRWVTPYLLEMDENVGQITEIIEMDENVGQITEIIDKRLCGGYDMKSVINVAKIAMRCVQALPSSRPTVSEVVAELKEAIKQEDKDLLAGQAASTERKGMEWSDNSSNMSKVGR